MSCIQMTVCRPSFNVLNLCHSHSGPSIPCIAPADILQLHKNCLKLTTGSSIYQRTRLPRTLTPGASSYQLCAPVCLFGGKGKSDDGKETSPWKSLEKAMGSLKKEQSLEDVLREQMEKQEYYDEGGDGGNRPGGGGGGAGGSGGSEDEGLPGILDEILQVTLATIGFIFLYIYIIEGEEITVLARDYIKFLFGGQATYRIRRLMYQWGMFYQRLTRKKEIEPYWLEKAILATPTWWDSPTKYKRMLRPYLASREDDSYPASREYDEDDSYKTSREDDEDYSYKASREEDEDYSDKASREEDDDDEDE